MKASDFVDKYTYRVHWSEEDGVHIARCLEFPMLLAHGNSMENAINEIKIVVLETIKWLVEDGKEIPEPFGLKKYKGNLTIRVPADVHRELAIKSAEQGVSINKYILSKL